MFDIITFGSASKDIFLMTKDLNSAEEKTLVNEEGVYFSLGSKIDIEDIFFHPGGGGLNTAIAFSRFGLKTAYCGSVGDDAAGEEAVKKLEDSGVSLFTKKDSRKKTNHSVVLNIKNKDRTILVYRGASELVNKKDIPSIASKWFYIAPLSGKASVLFKDIVSTAVKKKIKVAANPGNSQLLSPGIKKIIGKIDILLLNQEEASILSGIPYKEEELMFKELKKFFKGIVVITKGPLGVSVFDGNYVYSADILKTKVVDRTGAGDAFGSGFVFEYIRSGNIEKAIQSGTANATSCLKLWGASNGAPEKRKVKVKKNEIS